MTGLPVTSDAMCTASSTSSGAQQFTPTATTSGTSAATANASASGCPARVVVPAIVYDSHAGTPSSCTNPTTASASSTSGTVSTASTSGSADASTSSRGRCQSASCETDSP